MRLAHRADSENPVLAGRQGVSMQSQPTVSDVTAHYYDSDYPSEKHSVYPENFDEITGRQGVRHDVNRYLGIARETDGDVLELCCGTGRVAIPLACDGIHVTGVDVSPLMLDRFRRNLGRESRETRKRITIIEQDVTRLCLDRRDYSLGIMAFNSLLTIAEFEKQIQALQSIAEHLRPGALLAVDVVNPLRLKLDGDPVPRPFFRRRNPDTGRFYTRFAMVSPLDGEQRQRLHGWYDDEDTRGALMRRHYSMHWRPVFRYELQLMLSFAGFDVASLEGNHLAEPFSADSSWMFTLARRR